MLKPSLRGKRRSGLTLVEVLAGLTLLATLATSILLGYAAHRRQIRTAEDRIVAVEIADQLLSGWYASGSRPPMNQQGFVPVADQQWRWRTRLLRPVRDIRLSIDVMRLEIRRPGEAAQDLPTLAVEVMVTRDE